jgi:two-component system CheB/CheR fusion protein
LADPPFSRIDLVSCRNLLIYLRPEAQAKVLLLFHFALREGGVLLLGNSETVGDAEARFEVISKAERLYRHVGRSRPGEIGSLVNAGEGLRARMPTGPGQMPTRQTAAADICRRLVTEAYAPPAVLINRKCECLYSLGPTDRFLRLAPGQPTNDLLAMARDGLRTRLRSTIQQALQENARVVVPGGRISHDGAKIAFSIDVQPVLSDGEALLLVCFVEAPKDRQSGDGVAAPEDAPRVGQLEQELEATRTELQGAIRNLEDAIEEQKAANEEALSVNEEFQSTNEELATSKEELQSLNEELTALNSQLQETLDRQRTTSNALQNVLYSTNVATIFLDVGLNIRFFTPAVRSLFNLISGDVGRPLANFTSLVADSALLTDAQTVLKTLEPLECEIQAQSGAWFVRRILPYRTQDNGAEGMVITFADVTGRRRTADALEAAKRQAEQASVAKSRFLAAASHDLRQPLQTLLLLQGLLERAVEGETAEKFLSRLGKTLDSMSGLLNTLLDVNQIEAGVVHAQAVSFPIDNLLGRLGDEFADHARANGLALRTVRCGLSIDSDPRLLEQIIRNLLSNALKYTRRGKVLLGCRRHGETLSIEVWDTGIGIPETELTAIFEEYHQLDNASRERSRGLGLGLAIVQRLGNLLGHRISVHSRPGKGSVFAIEVALSPGGAAPPVEPDSSRRQIAEDSHRSGVILIVEDDPEVCDLLEMLLKEEGHRTAIAHDGNAALEWVKQGNVRPDLILADYNLPNGMTGLQIAAKLREVVHRAIPVVILTGDILPATLRDIGAYDCVQLNKPVKLAELTQVIQDLLPTAPPATHARPPMPPRRIAVRRGLSSSSSMTTRMCARPCATCPRKRGWPSRIMSLARPSSTPIVRAAKCAC